jgi:hypothetical protein
MIVKIQRPLSDPAAPFLIYPKGQGWMATVPQSELPNAVIKALLKAPKAYFHAELLGLDPDQIAIGAQAEEQEW